MTRIDEIVAAKLKAKVPEFEIGDSVDVQVRIREGDKTRIQVFSGTVIRIKGGGIARNFTVRRIVQGEGVERIFPLHSPSVSDVIVRKKGRVRRSRLYYLRDRTGKATRLKERVWTGTKGEGEAAPAEGVKPAAKAQGKGDAPAKTEGEPKPAPKKEPKPEAKGEPKKDAKPAEAKPEAKKEAKAEAKKDAKPEGAEAKGKPKEAPAKS
jgi:large subunit ribosomal protein L19